MLQITPIFDTGYIKFRPEIHEDTIEELLHSRPLKILAKDQDWDISKRYPIQAANRYHQMINNSTFQLIEVLNINTLKIRWNQAKNIIREIKDIAFPCLQELYLNANNIEDIEIFININVSSLKVLNFKENNINSVRSLRKCNLPNLEQLMLYKNKIIDFRPLFEMNAPKLRNIWTTPQSQSFDMQISMSWIFRLQSRGLKNIYVKHEKGEPFDFSCMRAMAKVYYPGCKLIYRIKDDIAIRRD